MGEAVSRRLSRVNILAHRSPLSSTSEYEQVVELDKTGSGLKIHIATANT